MATGDGTTVRSHHASCCCRAKDWHAELYVGTGTLCGEGGHGAGPGKTTVGWEDSEAEKLSWERKRNIDVEV